MNDPVFGVLEFDGHWVKSSVFEIFGQLYDVEIAVRGNNAEEEIFESQRRSYTFLERNRSELVGRIEREMYEFVSRELEDICSRLPARKELLLECVRARRGLSNFLELVEICFPIEVSKDDVLFGLVFECAWDEEHGFSATYKNNEIGFGNQDSLI